MFVIAENIMKRPVVVYITERGIPQPDNAPPPAYNYNRRYSQLVRRQVGRPAVYIEA